MNRLVDLSCKCTPYRSYNFQKVRFSHPLPPPIGLTALWIWWDPKYPPRKRTSCGWVGTWLRAAASLARGLPECLWPPCEPLYREPGRAHAVAHLHFIHTQKSKTRLLSVCIARRHAPAPWDPRVGTPKCKCALSQLGVCVCLLRGGGELLQLFIAGHLVKMCPFLSPRVLHCAAACHYLLMRDFYAGRTREAPLWCKLMDSSKGKLSLYPHCLSSSSLHCDVCPPVEDSVPTKEPCV